MTKVNATANNSPERKSAMKEHSLLAQRSGSIDKVSKDTTADSMPPIVRQSKTRTDYSSMDISDRGRRPSTTMIEN